MLLKNPNTAWGRALCSKFLLGCISGLLDGMATQMSGKAHTGQTLEREARCQALRVCFAIEV